jgi:hypothetical protein
MSLVGVGGVDTNEVETTGRENAESHCGKCRYGAGLAV